MGFEGRLFLDIYELPLTRESGPVHTIWTEDTVFPVLGTDVELSLGDRIFGIALNRGGKSLWLSDTDNHRVLRVRDPLTAPVVDVILGQAEPNGDKCNRLERIGPWDRPPLWPDGVALDMICFPGALSFDRSHNLFVSDHSLEIAGNQRLLMFPGDLFPTDNSSVFLAPESAKGFTKHGGDGDNLRVGYYDPDTVMEFIGPRPMRSATLQPAFDSANHMAVGYNMYTGGRFVGVYGDPLGQSSEPTGFLKDLGSMPYAATFDENDNLYVGDINRARVLVYWNPFDNPPVESGQPSSTPTARTAPLREYPMTVESVSPELPYCALRQSVHDYEMTLGLTVSGSSSAAGNKIEFRKVTTSHLERISWDSDLVEADGPEVTIDLGEWGKRVWAEDPKVLLTLRLTLDDGTPISNWSPTFWLADDVDECGIALPAP